MPLTRVQRQLQAASCSLWLLLFLVLRLLARFICEIICAACLCEFWPLPYL